jgi:hypothetical protein
VEAGGFIPFHDRQWEHEVYIPGDKARFDARIKKKESNPGNIGLGSNCLLRSFAKGLVSRCAYRS